jgi:hypothetical protein
LSEERVVLFNLAAITRRHLFAAARSMLDDEHYGPSSWSLRLRSR